MNEAIDAQSRMNDDIAQLRARLEESEWERQQKYGELSMLKSQLKDIQAESAQRGSEIVALRTRNRELQALVARRDAEAVDLNEKLNDRNLEIGELEQRLSEASSPAGTWHRSPGSISPQSLRNPSGTFSEPNSGNWHDDRNYLSSSSPPGALTSLKRDELIKRLYEAEARCNEQEKFFNIERRQWADDKSRVIRYQKQLQANYVQTYKRCGALEREVKLLTPQQQRSSRTQQRQTKEHAAELSYPMEI
uniref:Uncharacterized protein n=1 Tax=Ciona savignyi TaxID=51511 RepID=H2ZMH5_CIOSA